MAGQNAQFRYGFESAEGVPDSNSQVSARFASETFAMSRPYEADPNLDPSGNETEGDNLQAEGTGNISAAPNSESFLQMRIHQHGFYEHSTPAAGVELWELRDFDEVNDTPLDHYVDSLWAGIWRDQRTNPSEYNIMGLKATEFTLSVDANKHVMYEHAFLFLRDRYMRNPTEQAVNAAFTGEVVVRGHRRSGDENGDHYKFKVPVGGGGALDGTADIEFGKGAAAYGATDYPVVAGVWIPVRNADGTIAGTREEPIEIMFIANPGDVLTAGDEWFILASSPKPVAVYSARPKLNGTKLDLVFNLNGVTPITRTIESFSLKMGTPREAKFGLGSKYAQEIGFPDNSKRWWEVSFNSRYVDRVLEQALISGTRISAYAKFYGALIGATGFEDFAEFTLDNTKSTQAGATVTGAGDLDEDVTLRAFSTGGSLCVERYQNTVASVAP